MLYVNYFKKTHKEKTAGSPPNYPDRDHSDQIVFGTVRREAAPREWWPNVLKTKLAQRVPSSSNPLRSDGSRDGKAGDRATLMVAKGAKKNGEL
jgi:hypothetical protein